MKRWLRYLDREMASVDGWLDPIDAMMIGAIAECQDKSRVIGGAVEIGVHHGKLFLLLKLLLSPEEKCLAIDLFENQRENVDRSGCGDWETFISNFRRLAGSEIKLEVLKKSSLETHIDEIISLVGSIRLFSVDGGHTAECTFNDLHLASASIVDGGLVILDDYFNPHWPDVSIGTGLFLRNPNCRITPFAIGRNKILLTTPSHADLYRSALNDTFSDLWARQSQMAGTKVDIYGVSHTLPSVIDTMKLQFRRSKFGRRFNQLRLKVKSRLRG